MKHKTCDSILEVLNKLNKLSTEHPELPIEVFVNNSVCPMVDMKGYGDYWHTVYNGEIECKISEVYAYTKQYGAVLKDEVDKFNIDKLKTILSDWFDAEVDEAGDDRVKLLELFDQLPWDKVIAIRVHAQNYNDKQREDFTSEHFKRITSAVKTLYSEGIITDGEHGMLSRRIRQHVNPHDYNEKE